MYSPTKVYSLLSIRNLYTAFLDSYEKGFVFLGETHNFWELTVILGGSAVIVSEKNVYRCKEGDLVIHAPNAFHSMRVDEGVKCRAFTVSFDGSGLSSRLKAGQYTLNKNEEQCIDGILKELTNLFGQKTDFTRLFGALAPDNFGVQIIKNQLELLLLSLISRGERGLPSTDVNSRTYAKIVAFLRDNVQKNLTVSDISHAVFESPTKIKDIFRTYTGGGVMSYFNHIRCEYIIEQIRNGKSVKDIAAAMEFSSPYYLSYFFKRETGKTIREYKNTL